MSNILLSLLVIMVALGCARRDHLESLDMMQVSNRYPICVDIKETIDVNPTVELAHDFEVVDIDEDGMSGTIYIGDFPDYAEVDVDDKKYEVLGDVVFVGKDESTDIQKFLYRFGLGKEPSIYVLLSFRSNFRIPRAFETGEGKDVVMMCSK